MRWLECLIWPGRSDRLTRLRQAVGVARQHPAPIVQGDLLEDLPALLAQVPEGTTPVVFHSAVLAYVGREQRTAFAELMTSSGVRWISNESPGVTADLIGCDKAAFGEAVGFVLSVDRKPVARTHGHGDWYAFRRGAR